MTLAIFKKHPTPWIIKKHLMDDWVYDYEIRDAKGRNIANVLEDWETAIAICDMMSQLNVPQGDK